MGLFESTKKFLGSAADSMIDQTLNTVARPFLNRAVAGYGEIRKLSIENRRLKAKGVLCGLEDKEIEVSCGDVRISEDGSKISLHGFSSNMPFAEKLLNNFATREYTIESDKIRAALVLIRRAF